MQQFPQFLRTSTVYTAINNLHWTEFAALVLNPGLEPFLQEKPFITAHFPSSPAPGSNKDVHVISLPHLDYCHGASTDNGKKRCLKGTQLSSTTFNNSMVNRGHRVPWETGLLSKESLCGSQNLGLTSCSSQCHKSRRNSLRSLPAFPCLYWALTRHGFHSVRDQWWPFEWNLSLELRKENKSYRLETTENVGRDPSIRQWVSLPLQFSRSSSRGPLLPC